MRYSAMSRASHLIAVLSMSGVADSLSPSFRRLLPASIFVFFDRLPLPFQPPSSSLADRRRFLDSPAIGISSNIGAGPSLSMSMRTSGKLLRRIATVTARSPLHAGTASWARRKRTRGVKPAYTARVRAYPSYEFVAGRGMRGSVYRNFRYGSGSSNSVH